MIVAKCEEVRFMDEQAKTLGIPGVLLMEHAALAVYEHLDKSKRKLAIVCGSGNNGGDGFALARLLWDDGYDVSIVCRHAMQAIQGDAKVYATICKSLQIPWIEMINEQLLDFFMSQDVLVDALFGTGLTRVIEGVDAQLIQLMNQAEVDILSIDIPSGVAADSGCILGCAIQANQTITFVHGKMGLYFGEGSRCCGQISICDIHMPKQLQIVKDPIHILDPQVVGEHLPVRDDFAHKGSYGKGLLIGGCDAMSGAVILAAKAALRSGIGTLTLAIPQTIHKTVASCVHEAMYVDLPQPFDAQMLRDLLTSYDVIAFGNGIGRSDEALAMLEVVLASDKPCIIDGDGLYLLGMHPEWLLRGAQTILTPHPKELSYLSKTRLKTAVNAPLAIAQQFCSPYTHVTMAVKGHYSLILGQQDIYLNTIGNDGLACGGSGDVLCGIILGLLAQGANGVSATLAGVYLHALCADLLLSKQGNYSMLPSDIIEALPLAFQQIPKKKKIR